jgi:predicted TIM-barrel fold metal-dependent hydrolase
LSASPIRPGRDFPIIDVHTHLFPERLFAAVRKWFSDRGWRFAYPTDPEAVAAWLRERGVERFWFFNYAHRPGMARDLNAWNARTAERIPGAHAFGTIHPDDPDLLAIAEEALGPLGLPGFKLHLDVQRFALDDPRLAGFLSFAEERGCLLVIHGGTAASHFDPGKLGVAPFRRVLAKHPRLRVVAAHLGAFEVDAFLTLARDSADLYLDTCFCFRSPSAGGIARGPAPLGYEVAYDVEALSAARDRVLFGSDFPNIPFPWEAEVEELLKLDLDADFYRKVFHANARALMARLGMESGGDA